MATTQQHNPLGVFLKNRRGKLDPAAFGFSNTRRRTPGLRREEVAQRANISSTWYTWLEQGRGGAPSEATIGRIAQALMLTDAEREHLFLLALGHPPEAHYEASESISPRLQHVLDAMKYSLATVKTATWDVIAWNEATAAVTIDYAAYEPKQRNVLRLLFCDPRHRDTMPEWHNVAQFAIATFRADVVRAGASREIQSLVDELCQRSEEFEAMWRDSDVKSHGAGTKHLKLPKAGDITLEASSFTIDGRPDLKMSVWTPATSADAERIEALVKAKARKQVASFSSRKQ